MEKVGLAIPAAVPDLRSQDSILGESAAMTMYAALSSWDRIIYSLDPAPSHDDRPKMIDANTGAPKEAGSRTSRFLPIFVLAAGFAARLYQACAYFLNPDEALHNLLASQPTVSLAYKAALTNAHPPLLILVLYYWRSMGHSEWILRMPSVLAGVACCWLTYLWLKDVTDRSTAFIGLLLVAFAPALVGLSAEIRQYALLLFFMSGCLYLSERALRQNSALPMILFSLSLYGALLVHYSSVLFAFTIGIYVAVRLYPYGNRLRLTAVWAAGQVVGVIISEYFLVTHVMRLHRSGMTPGIYETWLKKSIYHSGDRNPISFAAAQTLRIFTYTFSHGVIGALALLAFLAGMVFLLRGRTFPRQAISRENAPRRWHLAFFLGLGFAVNCGAALAGQYPYGATRHSAWLILFAVSGASIGLAPWARLRLGRTSVAVALCLFVCNFFPAPPPAIRPRNQARARMLEAVSSFRQSADPGSLVFADYQSGLLFGYYLCGHGVVQVFPPLQAFAKTECGSYTVITTTPEEWKFYAQDTPKQLADITSLYNLLPGTKLWIFDAGWITDSAPALRENLQKTYGCTAPQNFGENIFLCQLEISR